MTDNFPKRIVLSRKGFDSVAGGCASPIFEGGRMVSLPIPENEEKYPEVTNRFDLLENRPDNEIATWLQQLSPGFDVTRRVHLDPDIRPHLRRWNRDDTTGWYFGQGGGVQTELCKLGACVPANNTLFLFYGWFKGVEERPNGGFRYVRARRRDAWTHNQHVIWGWLQSEGAPVHITVPPHSERLRRADHHPHLEYLNEPNNYMYVGRTSRIFDENVSGAGVFSDYHGDLRLTCPNEINCRTKWHLPAFLQECAIGRFVTAKWGQCDRSAQAQYRGFGQEFVFDVSNRHADAGAWLKNIFEHAKNGYSCLTPANVKPSGLALGHKG